MLQGRAVHTRISQSSLTSMVFFDCSETPGMGLGLDEGDTGVPIVAPGFHPCYSMRILDAVMLQDETTVQPAKFPKLP